MNRFLFSCSTRGLLPLSALALGAGTAAGQCVLTELQPVAPSSVALNDFFGCAVATDGSIIAIASKGDDDMGPDVGRVALYSFGSIDSNAPKQVLYPADAAPSKSFGSCLAISGGTMVIGAPLDDTVAPDAGAAYVFTKLGETWWQTQKLLPTVTVNGDKFGSSVAIDGNQLVVGTAGSSNRAYVYLRSGSTWSSVDPPLVPTHGNPIRSVAISANRIVIGTHAFAHIYHKPTTSWTHVGWIQKTAGFGTSVAVRGDLVVVGDPLVDGGKGKVFVVDVAAWGWPETLLVGNDSVAQDAFGSSIAFADGVLTVGSPGSNGQLGAVYCFQKPAAVWLQTIKSSAKNPIAGSKLGSSVAVGGQVSVSGAPDAANGGIAYVLAGKPSVLFEKFGAGCVGAGGFTPNLEADGCASGGGFVSLELDSCLGGSMAVILIGTHELPPGSGLGCPILIGGVLPVEIKVPLFGSSPGEGAISIAGSIPTGYGPFEFVAQAFAADPTLPGGYSSSNGVRVQVQ